MQLISRTQITNAGQPIEWLELTEDEALYRVCRYTDTGRVSRVLYSAPGPSGVRVVKALDLDSSQARRVASIVRFKLS